MEPQLRGNYLFMNSVCLYFRPGLLRFSLLASCLASRWEAFGAKREEEGTRAGRDSL